MEDEEYKESEISKKVKELMDDGYEFGEAVREALKQGFADGGSIGIEVLFKPKRQNLFMGGPALTGQPLAIYNSMKAYKSFTDQEIADAIKQAGYDLPTADSGTTPPGSTPDSSNQSSGNDGRSSALPIGSVSGGSGLIGDYMAATQERQNRLTNPNVPTSFISSLTGGGQRDIGEMIRSGEIDTKKFSGIPLGVGSLIGKMLPDKYYDMSLGDQVFTQAMMGYTGPTVFGENTSGLQKDPFGLNVRSGFGNYAEAVGENFNQLRDTLMKDREGVTFNEETGMFEGINADAVNKQTQMIRNKYNFRKQQLGIKNVLDSKIKAADDQRERDRLAAEAKAKAEAAAKAKIAAAEKDERDRVAAAEKAAVAKAKKQRDMQAKIKAAEKAERDRVAAAERAAATKAKKQRDMQAQIAAAERAQKAKEAQKRNTANNTPPSRRGGGGGREDRGPGASSRGGTSATSSGLGNLGFSDIRLKENVELIGKSPSNINIYKFNYKNNPTTYQGAMAHEVPWASIKHSNGYMMIDYNKIDVEFKLYDVH